MGRNTDELAGMLKTLQRDLQMKHRKKDWDSFESALSTLALLCEVHGQKELCLLTQSLLEVLGHRHSGQSLSSAPLDSLFEQLCGQLSHFQWLIRARLSSPSISSGA